MEVVENGFVNAVECISTSIHVGQSLNWDRFNVHATREAVNRMAETSKFIFAFGPALAAAHVYQNGFPLRLLATISVSVAIIAVGVGRTRELAHALGKSRSVREGCIAQLCVLACSFIVPHSLSYYAPNDLMMHRVFLTTSLPLIIASPYCCHLPSSVFDWVVCPMWMAAWMGFHFSVDFLNFTSFAYAVCCCRCVSYLNYLSIQSRWQHFQATCALEEEREVLTATQSALHSMLSSLWDASCTCNVQGAICSSTPHLEQLLGIGEDLLGFAANDVEKGRLQDFLRMAAFGAGHQALSLQCSLRLQGSIQTTNLNKSALNVYDVALYAIKLPPIAPQQRVHVAHEDLLFVGIKADAPEATIAEPCGQTLHHACYDDLLSSLDDAQRTRKKLEGPICLEKHSRSSANTSKLLDECESLMGSSFLNYSDDPLRVGSSLASSQSVAPPSEDRVSHGTQTERIETCYAGVQTGYSRASRPPALPTTPSCRVTLNSRRRALRQFRVTPKSTVWALIAHAIESVNLNGKGCCYWHIALHTFRQTIAAMVAAGCHAQVVPHSDWQCQECFLVHQADEGDACDLCGSEMVLPSDDSAVSTSYTSCKD